MARVAGVFGAGSDDEIDGGGGTLPDRPTPILPLKGRGLEEEGAAAPPDPNPHKPWSKWTADTERAFLYALRLTGQASKAAAEIGRSKNSAFSRRRTDPAFARKWDEAVAAQQAEWVAAHQARLERTRGAALDDGAGGARLTPYRERPGGWDARKRGLFLRTLKRTKRVADACEAAGMSASAAYYLRSQSPRFAAAWEKALIAGAPPTVISAVLERAVEGWDDPIVYAGKIVAYRRRYSEGLLRDLLRVERAERAARAADGGSGEVVARVPARAVGGVRRGGPAPRYASREETDAVLMKKLDVIEARVHERERRAAAADWERWQRCWVDPAAAREEG